MGQFLNWERMDARHAENCFTPTEPGRFQSESLRPEQLQVYGKRSGAVGGELPLRGAD